MHFVEHIIILIMMLLMLCILLTINNPKLTWRTLDSPLFSYIDNKYIIIHVANHAKIYTIDEIIDEELEDLCYNAYEFYKIMEYIAVN